MGSLLVYGLSAIAVQACFNTATSAPIFNTATFIAALTAIMIEMDYSTIPPFKTPVIHSVLSAIFAAIIAMCITIFLIHAYWLIITCGVLIGYCVHLFYDMIFETVFLIPLNMNVKKWFVPVDMNAFTSWQCWYKKGFGIKKEPYILNLLLCGCAFAIIIVCTWLMQI
jgi:hypothetical protein